MNILEGLVHSFSCKKNPAASFIELDSLALWSSSKTSRYKIYTKDGNRTIPPVTPIIHCNSLLYLPFHFPPSVTL